jgi:signal transduction histidine kinase
VSGPDTVGTWQKLLRQFKEKIAERLWSLPTVSETEKEILFKEYLSDLDRVEKDLSMVLEEAAARQGRAVEENELLRSLLGVPADSVRTKTLEQAQELAVAKSEMEDRRRESSELNARVAELTDENERLRRRVHELESEAERYRAEQLRLREDDIRFFSETHEGLKIQLQDLESRLANLRHLFAQSNEKLLTEKQEEVALLQKKLLEEMETALRRKQELIWGEEEMFAKGVAQRLRTTLVSAQGRLLLTLERLGLLDPQTKNESFWKARLRLLVDGSEELSENFKEIQAQLQQVTTTLDDYLHLTHRRKITKEPVLLKEIVQAEMAEVFAERRPTLSVEFLSDDPVPSVTGDPSLLRFIVRTLFANSLEALPNQSGQIIVALKNYSDTRRIQLVVRDSGAGIPPHLMPRLFQPFFTTKQDRQGLSLSRARRYAELHGGLLELSQSGPEGCVFQLELPLAADAILDVALPVTLRSSAIPKALPAETPKAPRPPRKV